MNNKIDNEYNNEVNYWGNINLVMNSNIDKDKVKIGKNNSEKEKIKNRNLEIKSDNNLTNELFSTPNDLVKNKNK